MDRALKIILPILLVIAIVFSIGWFLLIYDPGTTRDILVHQARRAEERNDHAFSTWLYELAYRQSGNDEEVAIELSQQFCITGNYTKAEYTLSNAIADGGSVDLYIALCNTYVQQDKLLDAVTMLDNVTDPVIRSQLQQMRPDAPAATPDQGSYNEYISVSFQAPEGNIYLTSDGSYPSTATDLYGGPITLPEGETTFYALTVDDRGLVSPLVISSYHVSAVTEEVTLTDPAIDQAVRQLLQVDEEHALFSNELWSITSFMVPTNAQTLEDLKWMPYLQQLVIRDNEKIDLSILGDLTDLQELVITSHPIGSKDLEAIASIPKLTVLVLNDCSLSGIAPLASATQLTYLDLRDNSIGDLTALSSMRDLAYVDLSHNAVISLAPLEGLGLLSELYLSYNSIQNVAPLSGCPALSVLDLSHNVITDISGLEAIPGLRNLSLAYNQLANVNVLSANATLGDLDISHNHLTDIQSLSALHQLIVLDLSNNQVTKLPDLTKCEQLNRIDGSKNALSSLNGLQGLKHLSYVNMEQNPLITSISPLVDCTALMEVNVYNTGITDVSALSSKNDKVVIKYTPI